MVSGLKGLKITKEVKRVGKYVNPIPYIDKAKKFEMRLIVTLDEVTDVQRAKEIVADYILGLSKEYLIKGIACTQQFAVYPESEGK